MIKKLQGIYRERWEYVRASERNFWVAWVLFLVLVLVGAFLTTSETRMMFMSSLKEALASAQDLQGWGLWWYIFLHNFLLGAFVSWFGFLLSLPGLLLVFVNGVVIGIVVREGVQADGWGMLWRGLAPHGVVELPAFMLAVAIGMTWGGKVWRRWTKKAPLDWKDEFRQVTLFVLWVLMPLFALAAFLESFVTPWLLGI